MEERQNQSTSDSNRLPSEGGRERNSQSTGARQQSSESTGQQQHRHHRHHRRHRTREEYERDLKREEREERRKRNKKIISIAVAVGSLLIILTALYAPQKLPNFLSKKAAVENPEETKKLYEKVLQMKYDGIDISNQQGIIDWQRLEYDSCLQFVFIKATEGSHDFDAFYKQNAEGAHKARIPYGAYHTLTSKGEIKEQFSNFKATIGQKPLKLVPMVCIEEDKVKGWTRAELQQNLAEMLHLLQEQYYSSPVIYTNAQFYNKNLSPRFDAYTLLLARYDEKSPVAKSAGKHLILQHFEQGIVDGITPPVNLNRFSAGFTIKDISTK